MNQIQEQHSSKRKKIDLEHMSTEDALYFFGLITLPIYLAAAFFVVEWVVPHFPDAQCIFWSLWGVYCPGCGGTRALTAMVHGHFVQSAWYHPLIMYCAVLYAFFMLSHTLEKLHVPHIKGMRVHLWMLYGMLVIIVVNCILKNVLKFAFGIVMATSIVI